MKFSVKTPSFDLRWLNPVVDNLSNYLNWMRDVDSNPYIHSVRSDYNLEDLVEFINRNNESRDSILMGIFPTKSEYHIGNLKFELVASHEKKAVMGMLIGDLLYRGTGVGSEILPFVFDELQEFYGIQIIELGVDSSNEAAIGLYRKVGFNIASNYGEGGYWMTKTLPNRNLEE